MLRPSEKEEGMELTDALDLRVIRIGLEARDKDDILHQLSVLLKKADYIDDIEAFVHDVYLRESEGVTGIGGGIAIPHGKSASVETPGIAIATLKHPIAWETLDGGDVDTVFLFCVGNDLEAAHTHLVLLSKVAAKLADDELVQRIRKADAPEEVVRLLCE